MPIKSTDDFIAAVSQEDEANPSYGWADQNWDKPVHWGPTASMEAGDAAGRLGIDMGEPSSKAAAFHSRTANDSADMVKQAFIGGALVRGATKLAPKLFGGATKAVGGAANLARKAPGAAWGGAKKTVQGGKKVMDVMEKQMPTGGFADRFTGIGGDVMSTANELDNALSFNF
jgi:hypothetical protein